MKPMTNANDPESVHLHSNNYIKNPLWHNHVRCAYTCLGGDTCCFTWWKLWCYAAWYVCARACVRVCASVCAHFTFRLCIDAYVDITMINRVKRFQRTTVDHLISPTGVVLA